MTTSLGLVVVGAVLLIIAFAASVRGNYEVTVRSKLLRTVLGSIGVAFLLMGGVGAYREIFIETAQSEDLANVEPSPNNSITETNSEQGADIVVTTSSETITPNLQEEPVSESVFATLVPQVTPSEMADESGISPAATIILLTPVRDLSVAEAEGSCGEEAFGDNLRTTSPLFQRKEEHTSGWISSDKADVILPNGSRMSIPSQFILIVEDLSSVQLQNVSLNDENKAKTWGCWFLEVDEGLVGESAYRDYQAKRLNEQEVVVYRVNSSGFEEIDPNSLLD